MGITYRWGSGRRERLSSRDSRFTVDGDNGYEKEIKADEKPRTQECLEDDAALAPLLHKRY